ncbi:MAG: hypothetical protein M3393_00785 [Actinomycetota bacterium]|nr:hypothetical protein [Actinomycetota bacterium]
MSEPSRLWYVCLTVAGELVEPLIVRHALDRLRDQRQFLHSLKYDGQSAEIQYWEEADSLLDASSLALRVWNEYRDSAGLPRWEVVGLEVLERSVFQSRGMGYSMLVAPQDVKPLPF